MYGIYKYENGLQFTGKIASSIEEAEAYLSNQCGKVEEVFVGKRDENGCPIYEERFIPNYNREAYKILPLEMV